MMNKKASAMVWILIVIAVLVIGTFVYFSLFYISESKARERIKKGEFYTEEEAKKILGL